MSPICVIEAAARSIFRHSISKSYSIRGLLVLISFCVIREMHCRKTTTTMTLGQIYAAWRCYYRAFVYFRPRRNLACADFVMSRNTALPSGERRAPVLASWIDRRGDIGRSRSARSFVFILGFSTAAMLGRARRRVSVSHYISRTIIRLFGI